VLQPNTGIAVTVILDDVVGRSKTLREAHVAPKCLGPWPLVAKSMPFSITMPAAT
jgi:hypothetical protein